MNKIILIILVLNSIIFAQSLRTKINEGNDKYNEEQFEEALNSYQDALIDDPQSAIAHFNRGDAFYKMEKYEQALEEYQKALSAKDINLEAKTHYNIGNAYFKQDKLQESIESYITSLNLNPEDKDAKYNLELARAKLKEMARVLNEANGNGKPKEEAEIIEEIVDKEESSKKELPALSDAQIAQGIAPE